MQVTGIILSGGQSTRMGTDKALLLLKGKTLLENAIEICNPVCNEILISSNNSEHEKFGYKIVPDEFTNCGPLSGIYSALKKSQTEWNFIISVDAAFVKPDFIHTLLNNANNFDAVVPYHNFGKEPLISMYNKSGLRVMLEHLQSKNLKIHNLLNALNTKYINSQSWVEKFPEIFRNLNRPDDL